MSAEISRSYQLLSPLERAEYFVSLLNKGYTKTGVASLTGKSLPYVSNTIRLLNLPDIIKDGLASGLITEGHARALLSVKNMTELVKIYTQIIKNNSSVRQTERMVKNLR